jgi:photosystem II stability/assembly factor-like uncharacterized protein
MTYTWTYAVLLACTLVVKEKRQRKVPKDPSVNDLSRHLRETHFFSLFQSFYMKNIYQILFFSLFFAANAHAQTWKAQTLPGTDSLSISDISIVNDTVAWASGWNTDVADSSWNYGPSGRVYRTVNGGTSWTASTIQGTQPVIGNIVGVDPTTAFAAVYDYTLGNFLYKTTNGGTTWTVATPPMNDSSFIDNVHFFTPARAVVLGDPRNGYFEIYQTSNAGQVWTRVPRANIPDPESGEFGYQAVYSAQGLNIWFGTSTGRIYRSFDGGNNWQVSNANLPDGIGRFAFAKNMVGIAEAPTWNSRTKEFSTTIRRSLDSGKTWVDATPTNNKFGCLYVSAVPVSNYFVMTGNTNNIKGKFTWLSRDSGKTWIVIDTVERILATEFIRANDSKKGLLGIIGYGGNLNAGTANNTNVAARIFSYNGTALTGFLTPSVLDAKISLSPNPVADQLNIQLTYKDMSNFRLNINDLSGALVYFEDFKDVSNINKSLNIKQLPSGTYILTVANPTGNVSRKFVKIN